MNAQVLDTYKLKSFNVSTIDHARNAYQNNNFKDSIECVTGNVNDQIMNLVASHDVCASSYAMSGNYVSAIQDAKLMIKLMPLAGYLRLGDLYTLHSNHFKAMKAYQQAMSYIDGENDNDGSCKAHLKKRYEYAKKRTESHTDMINKLPREVLDIIMMEHLTLNDRIVLLDVCQSWRNVAASSHSWWSSIKCDGGRQGITADELFNLSRHVGHHILDMEIYVNRYENFDVIFTQMINGKFNHLKKLTIKYFDTRFNKSLFNAITHLAPTLTHLEVDARHATTKKPIIPFNTIISTFQKIQTIKYIQPTVKFESMMKASSLSTLSSSSLLPPLTSSQLTNLILSLKIQNPEDIKQVLSQCPELRNLTLLGYPSMSDQLINNINFYCKKLEFLGYNHDLNISDPNNSNQRIKDNISTITTQVEYTRCL